MSTDTRRRSRLSAARRPGLALLVALLLVTLPLRAPITAVPPALGQIIEDLSLGPVQAGLATTLPLLCFGVFAFVTPWFTARLGRERTLGVALAILAVGLAVRLVATVPAFFGGALLMGVGVAVANVVIPAVVRARLPHRLALTMGLYTVMLIISGSGGAFVTPLLMGGAGWSWPAAIGVWLLPTLVGLAVWALVARAPTLPATASAKDTHHSATTPLSTIVRRPLAWAVTAVMGAQSLVFYTLLTWLPTQLIGQGWSVADAGWGLAVANILGLPGSFLGPRLLGARHRTALLVGVASGYAVGLVLIATGAGAVPGLVLVGLGQGATLAVALTAIAHQRDHADVPATSALAQGVGYLISASGPVLAGWLFAVTGGFVILDAVLIVVLAVWAGCTIWVARAEY